MMNNTRTFDTESDQPETESDTDSESDSESEWVSMWVCVCECDWLTQPVVIDPLSEWLADRVTVWP